MKLKIAMTFLTSCVLAYNCIGMNNNNRNINDLTTFITESIAGQDVSIRTNENKDNVIQLPDTLMQKIEDVEKQFCRKARDYININIPNSVHQISTTNRSNFGYKTEDTLANALLYTENPYGVIHALHKHDKKIRKFAYEPEDDTIPTDFGQYCPFTEEIDRCVNVMTSKKFKNLKTSTLIKNNAAILKSVLGLEYLCENYNDWQQEEKKQEDQSDSSPSFLLGGNFRVCFSINYNNKTLSMSSAFRINNKKLSIGNIYGPKIINSTPYANCRHFTIPNSIQSIPLRQILSVDDIDSELRNDIIVKATNDKINKKLIIENANKSNCSYEHVHFIQVGNVYRYYTLSNNSKYVTTTESSIESAPIYAMRDNKKDFRGTRMAAKYEAPINVFLYTLHNELKSWKGDKPIFRISENTFEDLLQIIIGDLTKYVINDISDIDMSVFKLGDVTLNCKLRKKGSLNQTNIAFHGLEPGSCQLSIPDGPKPTPENMYQAPQDDDSEGWQTVGEKKPKNKKGKKK